MSVASLGDGDNRRRNFTTETMQKFAGNLEHVKREANSLGISSAALAIHFCVSNQHVSYVIPGIRTVDRARDNAAACEPLPNDVMQRLLAALARTSGLTAASPQCCDLINSR